jgi:hypothetical protein
MEALNLETSDILEVAERFKKLVKELMISQFDNQEDYAEAIEIMYKVNFHFLYWGIKGK